MSSIGKDVNESHRGINILPLILFKAVKYPITVDIHLKSTKLMKHTKNWPHNVTSTEMIQEMNEIVIQLIFDNVSASSLAW